MASGGQKPLLGSINSDSDYEDMRSGTYDDFSYYASSHQYSSLGGTSLVRFFFSIFFFFGNFFFHLKSNDFNDKQTKRHHICVCI